MKSGRIAIGTAIVAVSFGMGAVVSRLTGPQPEVVFILECTLGTETNVPLSSVDTPIRAKLFGNGVIWYVADDVSNNAPYIYAQRAGEFCSVKEEK